MGTHPIFESDFDCLTEKMSNKMMTAQTSLLKYDSPVLISSNKDVNIDENPKPLPAGGRLEPIDSQKAEDILPKILPPIIFEKDGQLWNQKVSATPATRLDVERLVKQLDKKLLQRQARETGICPIRRELYKQTFDEIIMTLEAYKTIYESSTGFGCRKALSAKKDEYETVAQIDKLTSEITTLQNEANELTARIEAIKRKEGNEREVLKRKHAEEVQFLKRNNQQLKQQLEGIVQSKK